MFEADFVKTVVDFCNYWHVSPPLLLLKVYDIKQMNFIFVLNSHKSWFTLIVQDGSSLVSSLYLNVTFRYLCLSLTIMSWNVKHFWLCHFHDFNASLTHIPENFATIGTIPFRYQKVLLIGFSQQVLTSSCMTSTEAKPVLASKCDWSL